MGFQSQTCLWDLLPQLPSRRTFHKTCPHRSFHGRGDKRDIQRQNTGIHYRTPMHQEQEGVGVQGGNRTMVIQFVQYGDNEHSITIQLREAYLHAHG